MVSAIQQKINEHVQDPIFPRYTIILENVDGDCTIPRGVRLFLNNCGIVTVTHNDGNNQLEYRNGQGLITQSYVDGVLVVENAPECDLMGLGNLKAKFSNIISKHLIASGMEMSSQDSTFGNCVVSSSKIDGEKTNFEKLVLSGSEVHHYKGEINILTTDTSEYYSEENKITEWESTKDINTLLNTQVLGKYHAADTRTVIDECTEVHNIIITRGEFLATDNTFPDPTSLISADIHSHNNIYSDILSTTGCKTYTDKDSYMNNVTHTNPTMVQRDSTYFSGLNCSGGSIRWNSAKFKKYVYVNNSTVDGLSNIFLSTYTQTGGSIVKKKDEHSGATSIDGLVGRNRILKGHYRSLSISGDDKSHLEMAEVDSDVVSISKFAKVYGDSLSDINLSYSGQAMMFACNSITANNVSQLLSSNCGNVFPTNTVVIDYGSNVSLGPNSLLMHQNGNGYGIETSVNLKIFSKGSMDLESLNRVSITAPDILITAANSVNLVTPMVNTTGDMSTAGVHTDSNGVHV